jgi:hypothetical protein
LAIIVETRLQERSQTVWTLKRLHEGLLDQEFEFYVLIWQKVRRSRLWSRHFKESSFDLRFSFALKVVIGSKFRQHIIPVLVPGKLDIPVTDQVLESTLKLLFEDLDRSGERHSRVIFVLLDCHLLFLHDEYTVLLVQAVSICHVQLKISHLVLNLGIASKILIQDHPVVLDLNLHMSHQRVQVSFHFVLLLTLSGLTVLLAHQSGVKLVVQPSLGLEFPRALQISQSLLWLDASLN